MREAVCSLLCCCCCCWSNAAVAVTPLCRGRAGADSRAVTQILQILEALLKQSELLTGRLHAELPRSSSPALFLMELCAKAAACSKPGSILRCSPLKHRVPAACSHLAA